jgi:hypothetical protein
MVSKTPAMRSESALFIWQPKVVMWYWRGILVIEGPKKGGRGSNIYDKWI